MKKKIVIIGGGLVVLGVLAYWFAPATVPATVDDPMQRDYAFKGGEWEVTRSAINMTARTGKSCVTDQELSEFYDKDFFLKDSEAQCDHADVDTQSGYEINSECRNQSARYHMKVVHRKVSTDSFTLDIDIMDKDDKPSYWEKLEAKRLGDCP